MLIKVTILATYEHYILTQSVYLYSVHCARGKGRGRYRFIISYVASHSPILSADLSYSQAHSQGLLGAGYGRLQESSARCDGRFINIYMLNSSCMKSCVKADSLKIREKFSIKKLR
jgi:hypothetical protein